MAGSYVDLDALESSSDEEDLMAPPINPKVEYDTYPRTEELQCM
jgi:hypothetical protein